MIRLIPKSIFEINLHDPSLLMNIYHEWENVVEKEKKDFFKSLKEKILG